MRSDPRRERANAEVEVPPASTSFYLDEDGVKTPMKVGLLEIVIYKITLKKRYHLFLKELMMCCLFNFVSGSLIARE